MEEIEFVKQLITDQRRFVAGSDAPNDVASGLFQNDSFRSVIFDRYGADYYRETKIEFRTDPKHSILQQLDLWLNEL